MTRTDKNFAIKLRREGKTYGEITKILGHISKSTLTVQSPCCKRCKTILGKSNRHTGRTISENIYKKDFVAPQKEYTVQWYVCNCGM
jgi:ribosomal protein L28